MVSGLRGEDLWGAGQKKLPSESRSLAAWAVWELANATLTELAEWVKRDSLTLSAAIRRFEVRLKNELELARKVEKLKGELEVTIFQA